MGILIPGFSYEERTGTPEPIQTGLVYRLTSSCMQGEKIEEIQKKIAVPGYGPPSQDGVYGPRTFAAVVDFQKSNGLVPDGEVGPETARSLRVTLL